MNQSNTSSWHSVFKRTFLLVFALVVLSTFGTPLFAQDTSQTEEPVVLDSEEALRRDAEHYAASENVSIDEAIRRLRLQGVIGDLSATLEANERDTFAGLWIQHSPEYRVVVQFTQDGDKKVQPYIQGSELSSLIEVRQAAMSLAQLQIEQSTIHQQIEALGVPINTDINVFQNHIEVHVTDQELFETVRRSANLQLPQNVKIVPVEHLLRDAADIYAGRALSTCTSGFAVKNSSQTKGITTSGHCGNTLSYNGTNLPFQAERWTGAEDVQWHTAPGFTVRNWAYDGLFDTQTPQYRVITGTKPRDNQALNEFVCKYGKATNYGCGKIISKNVNGGSNNNSSTFIRVHNDDNLDLSQLGDSGGPWYSGSTAYGIMKAEMSGGDAAYMAINYVSGLGVSVLTQ